MSTEDDMSDLTRSDTEFQKYLNNTRAKSTEVHQISNLNRKRTSESVLVDLTIDQVAPENTSSLLVPVNIQKCSKQEIPQLTGDSDETTSTYDNYPFKEQSLQFKVVPTKYIVEATESITYHMGWHRSERNEQRKEKKHKKMVQVMEDFETMAAKDGALLVQRDNRKKLLQQHLEQWRNRADAATARRKEMKKDMVNREETGKKRQNDEETPRLMKKKSHGNARTKEGEAMEDNIATRIDSLANEFNMPVMLNDAMLTQLTDMSSSLPSSSHPPKSLKLKRSSHSRKKKKLTRPQVGRSCSVEGGGQNRMGELPIENENPLSVPLSSSLEHDKGIVFI